MIDTYLLKYFVEVKNPGTLFDVAVNLHLSQSTLSRSMQKIEQVIGVELFLRKKIPSPSMATEFSSLSSLKIFYAKCIMPLKKLGSLIAKIALSLSVLALPFL